MTTDNRPRKSSLAPIKDDVPGAPVPPTTSASRLAPIAPAPSASAAVSAATSSTASRLQAVGSTPAQPTRPATASPSTAPFERPYGPSPRLDVVMLTSLLKAPTPLVALVNPEWIWAMLNSPRESREQLHERFAAQQRLLQQLANTGGELMTAALAVMASSAWQDLGRALQSEVDYRQLLTQTRQALEAQLSEKVVGMLDDAHIDVGEQLELARWAFAHGLVDPAESHRLGYIPALVKATISKTVRDSPSACTIINPDSLSPNITWFSELIDSIEGNSNEIIHLHQAIQSSTIRTWLDTQKIYDFRAKIETLTRSNLHKNERAAWQLAWLIAWGGGVSWLDLNWTPSAGRGTPPRRVDDPDAWAVEVGVHGPEFTLNPVVHGILTGWLEHHHAPAAAIRAAANAESHAPHDSALTDIWIAAWRLGVRHLPLADGTQLNSTAHMLELPNDHPGLGGAVYTTLPAWLATVHEIAAPPNLSPAVRSAQSQDPTLAVQILKWSTKNIELKYQSLSISAPSVDSILAETRTTITFDLFGKALCGRWFEAWLAVCPTGDRTLDAFAEVAVHAKGAPAWWAQSARIALGDHRLDFSLALGSEGEGVVFEAPTELFERVHLHWGLLSKDVSLHLLDAWLQRRAPRIDKPSGTPQLDRSLQSLLWLFGDATVRGLDGIPFGHEHAHRFGTDHTPQQAVAAMATWHDTSSEGKHAMARFLETDALQRWLSFHLPELASKVSRFTAHVDAASRVQAIVSCLGSKQLHLNANLTVTSVEELISHARQHLPDIERLLDNGLLAAWSGNDFEALNAARVKAATVLDMPHQTTHAIMDAVLWTHNRAALAIIALGGKGDELLELLPLVEAPLPPRQPLYIECAASVQRGDVPLTRAAVSVDGTLLAVHDSSQSATIMALPAATTSFELTWTVDSAGPVDLQWRTTTIPIRFDHRGFSTSLKRALLPFYSLFNPEPRRAEGTGPIVELAEVLSPLGCAVLGAAATTAVLFYLPANGAIQALSEGEGVCPFSCALIMINIAFVIFQNSFDKNKDAKDKISGNGIFMFLVSQAWPIGLAYGMIFINTFIYDSKLFSMIEMSQQNMSFSFTYTTALCLILPGIITLMGARLWKDGFETFGVVLLACAGVAAALLIS